MRPVPSLPKNTEPDRFLKCQEAMADGVSDVALSAIKAGWRPEEVAAALVELADHVMLGILANRDVERSLANLRRR